MKPRTTARIKGIIERDRKVMFTTTRVPYPFVPDRAGADYAYDVSGNKFIDFSSFVSVYDIGDNAIAAIRVAAKKQIDRLIHAAFTDYYAELPVVFAEKLVKKFPKGFGRVFFSNSGTEANEAALKFSRLFTKRQYTMAFYNSFHGRTLGSLSLTASKNVHREHFGPFPNIIHVPYAYCYRCPFGKEYPGCGMACVDYIKKYPLSKEVSPTDVASIFIEPMQGEGGYILPPKEFMQGIREIASDNGIVLVADEIQSGYMRTGTFLAMNNFGVEADIYTMAKAIAGGLPMGATIARSSLGDIPAGSHANTFGGNLVAAAAANASIDYLNKNEAKLKSEIKKKSAFVFKRLNDMKERYEIVGDVRGIGMMIGMELVRSKEGKEPAVQERDEVLMKCFENGLIILPAGVSTIRIIPPLTILMKDLEQGMDILEDAVKAVNSSAIR